MVGVSDFSRAMAFYKPVLDALGIAFRFQQDERQWAGWQSTPVPRPLFLLGRPFNQQAHYPGNGQTIALMASSRQQVDKIQAIALENGSVCDGKPGPRPEYHPSYYGAYSRDPDGTSLVLPAIILNKQSCTLQPKRQAQTMAHRNNHGIAYRYTQDHGAHRCAIALRYSHQES
jgi:hypothetical protein